MFAEPVYPRTCPRPGWSAISRAAGSARGEERAGRQSPRASPSTRGGWARRWDADAAATSRRSRWASGSGPSPRSCWSRSRPGRRRRRPRGDLRAVARPGAGGPIVVVSSDTAELLACATPSRRSTAAADHLPSAWHDRPRWTRPREMMHRVTGTSGAQRRARRLRRCSLVGGRAQRARAAGRVLATGARRRAGRRGGHPRRDGG